MLVVCLLLLVHFCQGISPTGTYAPGTVTCPSIQSFLRPADTISSLERDWISHRQEKTNAALVHYLNNVDLKGLDAQQFIANSTQNITIAVALTGGNYRAMLVGAGQYAALDNRTENAYKIGLGGIMQSSTYIGALSGGTYLLGSLAIQNWPSVEETVLQNPNDIWNLTASNQLINTTGLASIVWPVVTDNLWGALTHARHWINSDGTGISQDLNNKRDAGYPVTLIDAWGRALSYQLLPSEDQFGVATTFSDIRDQDAFKNHDMPFPFIVAVGRAPGSLVYNENSTVFEFNPFEMGSFDPSLYSFTDIKYLGTKVRNGVPLNGTCIQGYDNIGFAIGSSAAFFNTFLNTLVCEDCHTLNFALKWVAKRFLTYLSNNALDVAQYSPNPFEASEYANSTSLTTNDTLYLVDGGLVGESSPLSSIMTTKRKLDVVFALDTYDWPDGSSLVGAYERQFTKQGESMVVPYVPGTDTFLHQNLTARPTFFGCDAKNLTDLTREGVIPPLVIYIPNRPYTYNSNVSLFQLSFTDQEKKAIITNGFETVSRLNGTIDKNWSKCVACAVIRREEERQGLDQSEECQDCFSNYCWDGTTFESDQPYYPPVNFTDNGLTNDSVSLAHFANLTDTSGNFFAII